MKRGVIDGRKCLGYGVCLLHDDEMFTLDDDTNVATVTVQPATPEAWERFTQAAVECPAGAISMVER
ncbi:MAG: 4Fe-4S single cluster domain of Ferredoxin [Frankiaceae bacterium]|jgi:ferredoxin|nr:4Fe-4S single cluster domain of Ferredoxin [Frankiaceae bacterium]